MQSEVRICDFLSGNINQSLMVLRSCLELLRENQKTGMAKVGGKRYRDFVSIKRTRLQIIILKHKVAFYTYQKMVILVIIRNQNPYLSLEYFSALNKIAIENRCTFNID